MLAEQTRLQGIQKLAEMASDHIRTTGMCVAIIVLLQILTFCLLNWKRFS